MHKSDDLLKLFTDLSFCDLTQKNALSPTCADIFHSISEQNVNVHRMLHVLTVVLADIVTTVSPIVFVETRSSVHISNTRTPVVVVVVRKY